MQSYHAPINCGPTEKGVSCAHTWVGSDFDRWDVISMNFGMWNVGPADTNASVGPDGKYLDAKLQEYIDDLRNISALLLQTRAARRGGLVWVNTNPTALVPECCDDPHSAAPPPGELGTHSCTKGIAVYNAEAWRLLKPLGFALADIYSRAQERCGKTWEYDCDVIPQLKGQPCQVHPERWVGAPYLAVPQIEAVKKAAGL